MIECIDVVGIILLLLFIFKAQHTNLVWIFFNIFLN